MTDTFIAEDRAKFEEMYEFFAMLKQERIYHAKELGYDAFSRNWLSYEATHDTSPASEA